jgi:hypothetical protein
MGCNVSKPTIPDDEYGIFQNLDMTNDQKCKALDYNRQMDRAKCPYIDTLGVLLAMKKTQKWCIYFHFAQWPVAVNAITIQRLKEQFEKSMRTWISKLKGYNGFPLDAVNVCIFGFVFNTEVQIDASFYEKYGNYPIVTNWNANDEKCPWKLEYNGKALDNPNFYRKNLDFTNLRVVGNKTESNATFSPLSWREYTHPENISYFQTKYWNGTTYAAAAQRHYLRISGIIQNYATGNMGTNYRILVHEMGHCFFLDDLYDTTKYNHESSCRTNMQPNDSIMFALPRLSNIDHVMLRHSWNVQKKLKNEF